MFFKLKALDLSCHRELLIFSSSAFSSPLEGYETQRSLDTSPGCQKEDSSSSGALKGLEKWEATKIICLEKQSIGKEGEGKRNLKFPVLNRDSLDNSENNFKH